MIFILLLTFVKGTLTLDGCLGWHKLNCLLTVGDCDCIEAFSCLLKFQNTASGRPVCKYLLRLRARFHLIQTLEITSMQLKYKMHAQPKQSRYTLSATTVDEIHISMPCTFNKIFHF